jgi:dTMP kinase
MRGTYIVLEGPDGSGTTSHTARLSNTLKEQGKKVLLTAEPTDGPIGVHIRQLLTSKSGIPASALQLLFCADRAMHMERTILPALERGDVIISDRSYLSTLAYGEALGLDVSWLEGVNAPFVKPDLLILALPPLTVCLERLGGRSERDLLETDSLQARVHRAYEGMASRNPHWTVVDTSGPAEDTAHGIFGEVNRFLGSRA